MHVKDQDKLRIERFLKNVPVFGNVSERHLRQITRDFTIQHAKKDETVFYQTDESTELYIVLKGKVKVTLLSEEGEEFILTDLNEGHFFGEMSLIDGNPRSATVVAEEDSTFAVLKRENLLSAIRNDPDIAIDLLKSVVLRLRKATEREEGLAFLAVRERVIKLFAKLIQAEGEKEKNGFCKIKRRTHKEIAERVGSSRESISKVIKALVLRKMIIENEDHLLISTDLCADVRDYLRKM